MYVSTLYTCMAFSNMYICYVFFVVNYLRLCICSHCNSIQLYWLCRPIDNLHCICGKCEQNNKKRAVYLFLLTLLFPMYLNELFKNILKYMCFLFLESRWNMC